MLFNIKNEFLLFKHNNSYISQNSNFLDSLFCIIYYFHY